MSPGHPVQTVPLESQAPEPIGTGPKELEPKGLLPWAGSSPTPTRRDPTLDLVALRVRDARRRLVSACCAAAATRRDGHGGTETLHRGAQPSRGAARSADVSGGRRCLAGPARLRRPRAGTPHSTSSHSASGTHVAGWCRRAAQQQRPAETATGVPKPFTGIPSRLGSGAERRRVRWPPRPLWVSGSVTRWPGGRQ